MSEQNRKRLYSIVTVNNNQELDYLNTNLPNMQLSDTDIIVLNAVYENRPDLLSYKYYGSFDYGWLIAHHNEIDDPNTEFTLGRKIRIPSLDEYFRFASIYAKNNVSRRRERL